MKTLFFEVSHEKIKILTRQQLLFQNGFRLGGVPSLLVTGLYNRFYKWFFQTKKEPPYEVIENINAFH